MLLLPTPTLTTLPSTHIDVDTTALSIAFGNQGQKLPLVSATSLSWSPFPSSLFPLSSFPLSALTDQVPLTSRMTTEKSTRDVQESEEGSQCFGWWFRRRLRLRIRGWRRGSTRTCCGMTAFAVQIEIGCLWRRSVTTCLPPTDWLFVPS